MSPIRPRHVATSIPISISVKSQNTVTQKWNSQTFEEYRTDTIQAMGPAQYGPRIAPHPKFVSPRGIGNCLSWGGYSVSVPGFASKSLCPRGTCWQKCCLCCPSPTLKITSGLQAKLSVLGVPSYKQNCLSKGEFTEKTVCPILECRVTDRSVCLA